MTRVTSQQTRQLLLVTGDPLDPNMLPEKVQLFNELGEPLMIGGGFIRHDQEETSGLLNQAQVETSTLVLYPSVRLFRLETNRPARVRVYPTATQRDADLSRPIGTKPQGNHGRLLEVVTTPVLLDLVLSPEVDMTSAASFDSEFFASVTNLDSVAGAVVVTYHYFRTE